jgi:hypothetical protein
VPRACVSKGDVRPTACDESLAPDGECFCVEGTCSKKPLKPYPVTASCETRGCNVDHAQGKCVADTGGVREGIRTNAGVNEGPSCDCIDAKAGCKFQWFDAVPCKDELDCWVGDEPRRHPVARPKNLRRPFKPCKDGEVAPACVSGKCRLGAAFKC